MHPSTGTVTRHWLERIHIDLCGPIPNPLGGNKYFLLITDEHKHHDCVEFLPKESDAFVRLKKRKLEAERESDLKLKYFKSDGETEYSSRKLKSGSHWKASSTK